MLRSHALRPRLLTLVTLKVQEPAPTPPLEVQAITPSCEFWQHALGVARRTLILLKMPASYLLFSTLAIFLFVAVVSFVIDTAHDSLVSLCDLPGMMHLPFCPTIPSWSADNPILHHVDYPGLVKVQNSLLDDLVGQSASGQVLALNVKHAELAVRDLIGLVRASNLTGRDALADALSGFVSDAQLTGRGLQQLSAKIHGTVDRCTKPITAYKYIGS